MFAEPIEGLKTVVISRIGHLTVAITSTYPSICHKAFYTELIAESAEYSTHTNRLSCARLSRIVVMRVYTD